VLWLGRAVGRFGRRTLVIGAIALWASGALLTLAPSLPVIIVGLAVAASGGFIVQATSTGYVALTAQSGRTSAIGFYATTYYVGGSIGGRCCRTDLERGRLAGLRRDGARDAGLHGDGGPVVLETLEPVCARERRRRKRKPDGNELVAPHHHAGARNDHPRAARPDRPWRRSVRPSPP
jgi:hypothetical protein